MLPLIPSPLVPGQIKKLHDYLLDGGEKPVLTLPADEVFLKNAAERFSRDLSYSDFFTYLCVSYVLKGTPQYVVPEEKKYAFETATALILSNPGPYLDILQAYQGKVSLLLYSLTADNLKEYFESDSQKCQNFIRNGRGSSQIKLALAEKLHHRLPIPPDDLIFLLPHILPRELPHDEMELYDWLFCLIESDSMDYHRPDIAERFYGLFLKMAANGMLERRFKLAREIAFLTPTFEESDLSPTEMVRCLDCFWDSAFSPFRENWFLEVLPHYAQFDKNLLKTLINHLSMYLVESGIEGSPTHPALEEGLKQLRIHIKFC